MDKINASDPIELVDNILQTARNNIETYWKYEFPDGKLPDRISFLLSEVSKEYRKLLSRAKKDKEMLNIKDEDETRRIKEDKMGIEPETYERLAHLCKPKKIETEAEYKCNMLMIDLLAGHELNEDQVRYLAEISEYIEKYEKIHYSIGGDEEKRKIKPLLRSLIMVLLGLSFGIIISRLILIYCNN